MINEDTTRHVLTGGPGHLHQWISYVTLTTPHYTTRTTLINPHTRHGHHHFGCFTTQQAPAPASVQVSSGLIFTLLILLIFTPLMWQRVRKQEMQTAATSRQTDSQRPTRSYVLLTHSVLCSVHYRVQHHR